jgi:hypothetical protein
MNNAASALMKLKRAKPKPKPKAKPNTPTKKESDNFNRVKSFIISTRSKKPNNNKKPASNFLKSVFTPRKNVTKK